MNWKQELVNASVSVNRAVWAMNELKPECYSTCTREVYIIREIREAIKDLNNTLSILNNELKFEE